MVAGSSPAPRIAHPKAVGELSELEVTLALARAGYVILTPTWTDNARYDLVIDDGQRFLRVQIKTGRLDKAGAILFPTSSTNWNTARSRSYHGQADVFAVYCPDNGKTYLVPVAECGERNARLRLERPRNGQAAGVRWAAHYELRARWLARKVTETRDRAPCSKGERPHPSRPGDAPSPAAVGPRT